MRFVFIFLFSIFIVKAQSPLDRVLSDWQADKALASSIYGFSVLDAATGTVTAEHNAHMFLIPASTLKVVTTAAALGSLGRFYRYETKIYFTGSFDKAGGILNGDIIIKGSGDPTLNSDLFRLKTDTNDVTDKWAQVLKEKGLKELRGKIIGDASCYDQQIPANWIWGDISNYFGVAPCGLSFNDNLYSIVFSSAESGSQAKVIEIKPSYNSIALEHEVDVKAAGKDDEAYVYGDPFGVRKKVKGTIPPHQKHLEVKAALPDPALLCAEFLQHSLLKQGIKTPTACASSNYNLENEDIKKEKLLMHTNYSPSLEKIIYYTNLTSNNLYSETMLKSLGKGSNYGGIEKAKSYCKEKGLEISELYMVDGNGLSRANTITTSFEANLLQKMYKDSVLFKPYHNSLPVAGVSGSMKNIGKGTFIEKNMRAKTGYINRARGYCGYVRTKSGRDLCFSVLFNNYNCTPSEMKVKIEQFLIALAEL